MTYYKLGCRWGAGQPDFYNMLIKHSIVICAGHDMKPNDIVAITKGQDVVAIACIKKFKIPVTERSELEKEFNDLKIDYEEWNFIADAIIWELKPNERFKYQLQQGICQIRDAGIKEQIDLILSSKKKNMEIESLKNLILSNYNLILTGAPGTGKTYLAKQLAAQIIIGMEYDEKKASDEEKLKMKKQYDFVQFHPSFDYTDFVEGLRPFEDEKGNVGFKREDGIFMKFCRKALDAYNKAGNKEAPKYVFVIDEINRGDISKIFGELFFSIDPGYRGEKGKVKTQYSNLWKTEKYGDSDSFYIPQNVYIIGTMNDIDRSVESMDFAMRRRFAFKEVRAEDNMDILKTNEKLLPHFDKIKKRMKNLNCAILTIQGLSTAYQIGAAYFLKLENYLASDGELGDGSWESLWDNHLNGLLFEYLRGLPNAEEDLETLRSAYKLVDLYKIENGKVIKEPSQNA